MTEPDLWKTHPEELVDIKCIYIKTEQVLMKFTWMSFPEIDLAYNPEN